MERTLDGGDGAFPLFEFNVESMGVLSRHGEKEVRHTRFDPEGLESAADPFRALLAVGIWCRASSGSCARRSPHTTRQDCAAPHLR